MAHHPWSRILFIFVLTRLAGRWNCLHLALQETDHRCIF
jgi:hypothetical protein